MDCPGLIRSWTSDILGCFNPNYVWHEMAQAWQTADVGEQAVAQMLSLPAEDRAQRYESLGMTLAIARKVTAGANKMARAILALYRSAARPVMRDLGAGLSRAAANRFAAVVRDGRFLLRRKHWRDGLPRSAPGPARPFWKVRDIGGCANSQDKELRRSTSS